MDGMTINHIVSIDHGSCELLPVVQASDAGLASQVALRAAEAAILDSLEARSARWTGPGFHP
jgi:hypothetical protein